MSAMPAAAAHIRDADRTDVAAMADLYCAVFPSRRLSRLGAAAVREYIRVAMAAPRPIALVAESESREVIGIALGYAGASPLRSFRAVSRLPLLLAQLTGAVIRRPSILPEIVSGALNQGSVATAGRSAFLSAIAIASTSRGQGIGARLLEAFILKAREAKAEHVFLEVERGAGPAIELYRRAGFVETETSGAGSEIIMTLRLAEGVLPTEVRGVQAR